jgi:hypothetical protein
VNMDAALKVQPDHVRERLNSKQPAIYASRQHRDQTLNTVLPSAGSDGANL